MSKLIIPRVGAYSQVKMYTFEEYQKRASKGKDDFVEKSTLKYFDMKNAISYPSAVLIKKFGIQRRISVLIELPKLRESEESFSENATYLVLNKALKELEEIAYYVGADYYEFELEDLNFKELDSGIYKIKATITYQMYLK